MNYIKNLSYFFNRIQLDPQIAPSQIALYIALFQCWNKERFENPIKIIRDEVMRLSKITSKSTYHRSMKILHDNQYIIYEPSYNPFVGSKVYFIDLSKQFTKPKNEQAMDKAMNTPIKQTSPKMTTAIDTPINTPIEPLYKHINSKHINNTLCVCKHTQIPSIIFKKNNKKNITKNQSADKIQMPQKEKSSAKKEKGTIPTFDEVQVFFQEKYQNKLEGEKFFYYFESNGWLVGGKTKMKSWKAAASSWMINSNKFATNNNSTFGIQKTLDTSAKKRYDEPL